MRIRLVVFFLCLLAVHVSAHSQKRDCGTIVSPEQRAAEMQNQALQKPGEARAIPALPYRIPLTIHICRMSDSTGGFTLPQLDAAMRQVNILYGTAGIQFFQYGDVIYINNTTFFTIKDVKADRDALRAQFVVENTVNVYFTNLDSLCGEGSFPGDKVQGVLMDISCAGTATNTSSFGHELGHFLNLYHTHETAYGMECPDGSNCTTTGDLLCDTPADPDLTKRVSGCTYIGGVPTPSGCGGTYNPQVDNMMSYSDKNCRTRITTGQADRMLTALGGSRKYLVNLVRYVDKNWPGPQTGSPDQPFKTIAGALGAAAPGMVIFANAGTYPENLAVLQKMQLRLWSKAGVLVVGQ
jgi:hypothetical protein